MVLGSYNVKDQEGHKEEIKQCYFSFALTLMIIFLYVCYNSGFSCGLHSFQAVFL